MALREDSLALHLEPDHYCIRHYVMFSVLLGCMIRDVLQLSRNSACALVAAAVAAAQQQHNEH